MQIQISWLLKKPTDLDLHCLQRQGISGFSRTWVKAFLEFKSPTEILKPASKCLILSMLGKTFQQTRFEISIFSFFFFFFQKIGFNISCKFMRQFTFKVKSYFLEKLFFKKNINSSSDEFAQRVIMVKPAS